MNWNVLIAAAGPVVLGIFTLYFNYKSRIKEKKYEIQFKAREHVYLAHQQEIDRSRKDMREASGSIGKILGQRFGLLDADVRAEHSGLVRTLLKIMQSSISDTVDELRGDLKKHNLLDDHAGERLSLMESVIRKNIDETPDGDIENLLADYMRAYGHITSFDIMVAKKKRDEMFGAYLK